MTTIDIDSNLDERHVARQMRKAIIDYMESEDFCPSTDIEPQVIIHLFTKDGPRVDMFTNESPDELKPIVK